MTRKRRSASYQNGNQKRREEPHALFQLPNGPERIWWRSQVSRLGLTGKRDGYSKIVIPTFKVPGINSVKERTRELWAWSLNINKGEMKVRQSLEKRTRNAPFTLTHSTLPTDASFIPLAISPYVCPTGASF